MNKFGKDFNSDYKKNFILYVWLNCWIKKTTTLIRKAFDFINNHHPAFPFHPNTIKKPSKYLKPKKNKISA